MINNTLLCQVFKHLILRRNLESGYCSSYSDNFVQRKMSIFISFVILAIASQSYAGLSKKLCPFTKCSYTGDPHLTPFPATYNGPQNQYMCSNVGWDLVVANPFIQVYAFVGPAPYWILDVSYFLMTI